MGRRAEACIEENGDTSRSMERWEERPGRLHHCDRYILLSSSLVSQ